MDFGISMPKILRASQVMEKYVQHSMFLESSIGPLDALISGLHTGMILEVCGPSCVGKSQLCLQLVANFSLIQDFHSLFVDTNLSFSANRILELANTAATNPGLLRIQKLVVTCVYTFISALESIVKKYTVAPIRLLVIDHLENLLTANPISLAAARMLKQIALQFSIIVVIVSNKSYEKINEDSKSNIDMDWRHVVDSRISMANGQMRLVRSTLKVLFCFCFEACSRF